MWLLVAFIAVPIIEIALFIQVGGVIGTWPTLGIVVLTAIVGSFMMRRQGAGAMQELQTAFNELRDPAEPLAHGAMILVAGVLLLTPGFFTDALGLSFLIPQVRKAVFTFVRKRIQVHSVHFGPHGPGPGRGPRDTMRPHPARDDVIDGDYHEVDDPSDQPEPPKRPTHRPSGWTKH
ncbi:FxsA family protein [Lutimaribacter sp. EGI FJ00015]|uniref:FxsA family protein n=1 Tax=Lutimaribacter degradans TaxID=2945989 RepID=A0ACC5ZUG8_9RHOB|nr:FxsA family protein [Lutimaribacter sp. EGI FJ00013]MCM2561982.1 FxsA family protein [Lutimaribacter sp. EGI FJ00013]MCO0612986.1 FxsA family protein [Lutimaribacter sp. EGI FJ00015]MCO0635814.1 FxsA family protein [Lutimaribacter sp. EGI FJ00014]